MITFSRYLNNDNYQKIFIVIKPGFLSISNKILEIFKENGFKIDKMRTKRLLQSEVRKLYYIHKNEDWFKSLCEYMASDASAAYILKRKSIEDSDVFKDVSKIKDDIRNKYGESDLRNVIHSSDNIENMNKEIQIYF